MARPGTLAKLGWSSAHAVTRGGLDTSVRDHLASSQSAHDVQDVLINLPQRQDRLELHRRRSPLIRNLPRMVRLASGTVLEVLEGPIPNGILGLPGKLPRTSYDGPKVLVHESQIKPSRALRASERLE